MIDDLKGWLDERVERVPTSGCWLWTGSVGPNGYARASVNGKLVSIHRLAHELYIGPITLACVDHLRRNGVERHCRACSIEMERKRTPKGMRLGGRLSKEAIALIQDSSESARALARRLGVTHRTILLRRRGSA